MLNSFTKKIKIITIQFEEMLLVKLFMQKYKINY